MPISSDWIPACLAGTGPVVSDFEPNFFVAIVQVYRLVEAGEGNSKFHEKQIFSLMMKMYKVSLCHESVACNRAA
jgi:hypothetical protein